MTSDAFTNFRTLVEAGRVTPETPIEEARGAFDTASALIPIPDGTQCEPVDADGVAVEWVRAPDVDATRAVLWLHGGGYVIGSPDSHRGFAARLSEASRSSVLLVDYRRAPEHPHPAALDDALGAYRWLLGSHPPERICWGGDSAGGGLALAALVAQRDQGEPLPAAAALLSPWLDLTGSAEAHRREADRDVLLSPELLATWAEAYLAGADPTTALASPLFAPLHDLPPLLVLAARHEILVDDATTLAERASAAGVEVELGIDEEMVHAWPVWAGLFEEADAAVTRVADWLADQFVEAAANQE